MRTSRLFFSTLLLIVLTRIAMFNVDAAESWTKSDPGFRVVGLTSVGSTLWACGTDESVSSSVDGGVHWQTKHRAVDGPILLNVLFPTEKFGFAAGTSGRLLTTQDGGETWVSQKGASDTILQASFSDPEHGIIRTPAALLFTNDGGLSWSPVSAGQNADTLKKFPYTQTVVSLDSAHMAVFLKEGPAEYYAQSVLITDDGGKTWKTIGIPSVTLYSLLSVSGAYWAVGTEVVGKDKPGGGHGVPVALKSSDGEKWSHSENDLSGCKMEGCRACTSQGCLASNGVVARIFGPKTAYAEFPEARNLSSKWAANEASICYATDQLQCADLKTVAVPNNFHGSVPPVLPLGPAGGGTTQGPRCLFCSIDPVLLDEHKQGDFVLKLSVLIAKNGTVKEVTVDGAPSPSVQDTVRQRAMTWLFEPYVKDGSPVNVRLNTTARVSVVKSR